MKDLRAEMKAVPNGRWRTWPRFSGVRFARRASMRSHERKISRSGPEPQSQRSAPKPGDVLVSERAARADIYVISVVPADAHMMVQRYDEAIKTVRELARQHKVDAWCTVDQTHYAQVASYRTKSSG